MKERPILFSGPMVLALLRGPSDPLCKTETRRVVKPDIAAALDYLDCDDSHDCVSQWKDEGHSGPGVYAWCSTYPDEGAEFCPCPYGEPGEDRLWCKETWKASGAHPGGADVDVEEVQIWYRADDVREWRPITGDHLGPDEVDDWCDRWIPRSGAGWQPSIYMPRWASRLTLAVESVRVERLHDIDDAGARREGVADREAYRALWEAINGAGSWDVNPWVWVVGFRRVTS